ncbi:DegV family protein [Paradesulfitobacterium ferrireducens]|uniref:DegV family protein n=1 Tax=Paradesulfitobacterium ferrireducens TaxID=2816476 RepID=UPI001A8F5D6F|nr:DegV family protein [Paradesulfitobacterium ferrireducens]
MSKTAIVMDSTGYLTSDILNQFPIKIVPLTVTIGTETFAETELSNELLLLKIKETGNFPTTSQPPVGAFLDTYEQLLAEGYEEIVSIHISQEISGTYRSAQMAREMMSSPRIHVLDSGSAALSFGLLGWAAGEMAQAGAGAEEIVHKITQLKQQTELYFIVDSLENLKRGGRIGGASALLGTLLQIKPILYINPQGEIDVFDKVRSRARAWQRALQELVRAVADGRPYRICLQHVAIPDEALTLLDELKQKFPGHDIRLFEAGAVIASHVGRGAFGISFQPVL